MTKICDSGKLPLQVEQTADSDGIFNKRRRHFAWASTFSNMPSEIAGATTTFGNPAARSLNRRTPAGTVSPIIAIDSPAADRGRTAPGDVFAPGSQSRARKSPPTRCHFEA